MDQVLQSLQKQQDTVSQDIDYNLFNDFNKKVSIFSYYKITPNDFNSLNESNKRIMVDKYYNEMKTILFHKQVLQFNTPVHNRSILLGIGPYLKETLMNHYHY